MALVNPFPQHGPPASFRKGKNWRLIFRILLFCRKEVSKILKSENSDCKRKIWLIGIVQTKNTRLESVVENVQSGRRAIFLWGKSVWQNRMISPWHREMHPSTHFFMNSKRCKSASTELNVPIGMQTCGLEVQILSGGRTLACEWPCHQH